MYSVSKYLIAYINYSLIISFTQFIVKELSLPVLCVIICIIWVLISRYLQLITKEHKLLKEEKQLLEEFNLCEHEERNSFTVLSSTVKDSHEKERAQAEKTKYWSLIGSIIGTVIGVVGSSINNEFKMRELRKMVRSLLIFKIVIVLIASKKW